MAAGREDRMNQCIFVGRLTGDPEIWIAENEARTVIGKMYIAVDRKVKKDMEKKADFFRCICFGKLAEFAEKYLKKGKRIAVKGRIENESFTAKDETKVSYPQLIVEGIEFADGKDEPDQTGKKAQEEPQNMEKGSKTGKQKSAKGSEGAKKTAGKERQAVPKADNRFLDTEELGEEDLPFN